MVLVDLTRVRRPVGVLLGGSGRPVTPCANAPKLSALLNPSFRATWPVREVVDGPGLTSLRLDQGAHAPSPRWPSRKAHLCL